MPDVPRLTAEQRGRALAEAVAARTVRAEARAALKAGELSLPDFLARAATEPALAGMRVSALIAALPGYGEVRSAALMRSLAIADSRRVRGLGPKQRVALLAAAGHPAESSP